MLQLQLSIGVDATMNKLTLFFDVDQIGVDQLLHMVRDRWCPDIE